MPPEHEVGFEATRGEDASQRVNAGDVVSPFPCGDRGLRRPKPISEGGLGQIGPAPYLGNQPADVQPTQGLPSGAIVTGWWELSHGS
jgi:hypothetical protein